MEIHDKTAAIEEAKLAITNWCEKYADEKGMTNAISSAMIPNEKCKPGNNYLLLKGEGQCVFFCETWFRDSRTDQQTRTSDRTFEGVPDPNCQTVPAGQPRPYLFQIRPNLVIYPEHAQNPGLRCSTCS